MTRTNTTEGKVEFLVKELDRLRGKLEILEKENQLLKAHRDYYEARFAVLAKECSSADTAQIRGIH